MTYHEHVVFEWDTEKDRRNRKKHGLSFSGARELFDSGVDYLEIPDIEHSDDEDRYLAIGPILRGIVVVAWTDCFDNVVRITTARLATRRERALYRKHMERDQ